MMQQTNVNAKRGGNRTKIGASCSLIASLRANPLLLHDACRLVNGVPKSVLATSAKEKICCIIYEGWTTESCEGVK